MQAIMGGETDLMTYLFMKRAREQNVIEHTER